MTKIRSCNNPSPENGGLNCTGPTAVEQPCRTIDCPGKFIFIFILTISLFMFRFITVKRQRPVIGLCVDVSTEIRFILYVFDRFLLVIRAQFIQCWKEMYNV